MLLRDYGILYLLCDSCFNADCKRSSTKYTSFLARTLDPAGGGAACTICYIDTHKSDKIFLLLNAILEGLNEN